MHLSGQQGGTRRLPSPPAPLATPVSTTSTTTTPALAPPVPASVPTPAPIAPAAPPAESPTTESLVATLVAQVTASGIDPGSNWSWSMGNTATHCSVMTGTGTGCTYGAGGLEFTVFAGTPNLALVAHELANAETQNDAVPNLMDQVATAEGGTSWSPTDAVATCLVAHFAQDSGRCRRTLAVSAGPGHRSWRTISTCKHLTGGQQSGQNYCIIRLCRSDEGRIDNDVGRSSGPSESRRRPRRSPVDCTRSIRAVDLLVRERSLLVLHDGRHLEGRDDAIRQIHLDLIAGL